MPWLLQLSLMLGLGILNSFDIRPFFGFVFFGIDCMYISGTVFLCVKQVGNVFVRPRGL